ncbi:MAG TPA: 3-phosphoglycerate dehydrogenase [Candidatus Borkfalkia faecavium]|uniref:D-3-phosphoglycerate dehydrogenase n=1 Tax=Candidatus Borkfalkia faecavium TaxID=2838508 RepID=A0A9D2AVP0_9FIRM|nr:3-phosphoglycerate dehydrogenase [Candidatus Borkfalkia faecavium]
MPEILKLNEISEVANKEFPESYVFSKEVKDPEGIMLRSFNMHEYPLGEKLLAVARAGAGTNNIPIPACTEKGIVVFNTPGANANAVKELVICELFLGGRKIVDAIEWVKTLKGTEGISKAVEKGKSSFVGHEVLGKTLGVIGLGAIGVMVANTAVELGMNVIGYDPYLSISGALHLDNRVHMADLPALLQKADFVTVHVPLTPSTERMFNAENIAKMKDGSVLINNSRGELVDTDAVLEALESGKLERYITDFPADKLIGAKNCICVPHLGASTPEAEDNCAAMAARELVDYIENGNITHSVNYPDVCAPRSSVCRITVMHENVKEVISKITSLISAGGINIANLLDKSKGNTAYMLLDLDDIPDDSVIEKIKAMESVSRVRVFC